MLFEIFQYISLVNIIQDDLGFKYYNMKSFIYLFIVFYSINTIAQNVQIIDKEAAIDFIFLDEGVEGTIGDFQFTGAINLSQLEASVFSGSVATSTLDTNNWLRSRHLRGKKFFNAKAHPQLHFEGTTTQVENDIIIVSGSLTIKGVSKAVVFRFKRNQNRFIGETSINTQDYNISVYDERERNNVNIKISLPFNG